MDIPLEEQRVLASKYFPDKWAVALKVTGKSGGKRRANLRKAAVRRHLTIPIRERGGRCSNCAYLRRGIVGLSGRYCDLDSDSDGYQKVNSDYCCHRHEFKSKEPSND